MYIPSFSLSFRLCRRQPFEMTLKTFLLSYQTLIRSWKPSFLIIRVSVLLILFSFLLCFLSLLIVYVDINLPDASEEFGNLGSNFSVVGQKEVLVHVSPDRVECKASALKTYLSICQGRALNGELQLSDIEKIVVILQRLIQTNSSLLHFHTVLLSTIHYDVV